MRKYLILLSSLFAVISANAQSEGARYLSSNPADIILGQETGVNISSLDGNPNGMTSVIIRGVNSLRSDSQPLWIVDGVIINTSLNHNLDAFYQYPQQGYTTPLNMMAFLDIEEVESVEVLKDVSATALYGSLGANGVIIVKTKGASSREHDFKWTSRAGASIPSVSEAAFKPSVSQEHHFRYSGTSSKTKFNISAFYRGIKATVPGTGSDFGGFNVGLETMGNDFIRFGMKSSFSIGSMNSTSGTTYFSEESTMIAARKADGSSKGWIEDYDDDVLDFRTVNSLWLDVNFLPVLKWHTELGLDFEDNGRGIWYGDGTPFGKEVNRAAAKIQNTMFGYNLKTSLDYNSVLEKCHAIKASLAAGIVGTMNRYNTMSGTDFFTSELRAKGISIAASERPIHRFYHTDNQYFLMAKLGYDYKSFVGIDGSVRLDTTPRYDDWKPKVFGGVTAFFDFRKAFFPTSEAVSNLRLSGGYGKAGRQTYVPYRMLDNYTAGGYPIAEEGTEEFYEGMNFLTSSEWNASLKAGFMDNRLNFGLSRYYKITDDALNVYCFGKLSGKLWERSDRKDMSSQTSTIGNAGWELSLDGDVIRTSNTLLNLYTNLTYSKNAVISLDEHDIYGKEIGSGIYCNMNSLGYPVGSLIGVKVDQNGNFIDNTGDGLISEEDKQLIGNPFPRFYGSFGANFHCGSWSAELLMTGASGFDTMNLNTLIGLEGPQIISEKCLERGNYLRLNRLFAGYEFKFEESKALKSLTLGITATNLFTLTAYSGWNPSANCFGMSTLAAGIDYGSFPVDRSVVLGVTLNF